MDIRTGAAFDAAPFAVAHAAAGPEGIGSGHAGLVWEDPRELWRVVVRFSTRVPQGIGLQYWRRRWPEQHLPKDRVPGGGEIGWWEPGNWYTGEWRTADAELTIEGQDATFSFRPVNRQEFPVAEYPALADYPATFRSTLKLRVVGPGSLPEVEQISAYTDSTWVQRTVTVLLQRPPSQTPTFSAYNGYVASQRAESALRYRLTLWCTRNPDPNSADGTLLTIQAEQTATVRLDDLARGPVCIPDLGLAVVRGRAAGDYLATCAEATIEGRAGVYDALAALPEQTWTRAWERMVPKRGRIYLPLAVEGGRHKFGLDPDGSVFYRTQPNEQYLRRCPGSDTPRLRDVATPLRFSFGLPENQEPEKRGLEDGDLPIGLASWRQASLRIEQTAFVTPLSGGDPSSGPPPPDVPGVLMMQLTFREISRFRNLTLCPDLRLRAGQDEKPLRHDERGLFWDGDELRFRVSIPDGRLDDGVWVSGLPAGTSKQVVVAIPYTPLVGDQVEQLLALDFEREHAAVAAYWRRRLREGMALSTTEPLLDEFHRAHAAHLLINCEREPGSTNRFARVGSFSYGAFGNESCMMIVDLDRRGYHREARECLEGFLAYQGTVPLPGDYDSHAGVLYGAHGYEQGGYNQHHGWILWCLVEHYRFTRDAQWLSRCAPNLLAAADWVTAQRARTASRGDLGRGLLPHGSLEDVGDWWQWLSTNCYSWRGVDAAAWALGIVGHEQAVRVRADADAYRRAILCAFTLAAERSPVVRLRDGRYVPHYPSQVHRRGRSFGWICETLEGAIHLLISGVLDPTSREAGWIVRDYEDNLHLSPLYGYAVENYARHWFDWGGFSMQACLLLDVEPYLWRDDVPQALRAAFNAIACQLFPDTRMLAEHALPRLGDWRGDHYKSSDEANAAGWLRDLFLREQGDDLLLGQAIPRDWLQPGKTVGVERAASHFGPLSLRYEADDAGITARLDGPTRNPPRRILLRFRPPEGKTVWTVTVNGESWAEWGPHWVRLPGDIGQAEIRAECRPAGDIPQPGTSNGASILA